MINNRIPLSRQMEESRHGLDLFQSHRLRMNSSRNYAIRVLFLTTMAILLFGIMACWLPFGLVVVADGHFAPNYTQLGSGIELPSTIDAATPGRIVAIKFNQAESFQTGEVLIKLDSTNLESQREQLRITNEILRNSILNLDRAMHLAGKSHRQHLKLLDGKKTEATESIQRQERIRESQLTFAKKELERATAQCQRYVKLRSKRAVSAEELEEAFSKMYRWQKDHDILSIPVSHQAIESIETETLVAIQQHREIIHQNTSQQEKLRQEVSKNEVAIRLLHTQINSTEIRAPYDGVIEKLNLRQGNWAKTGQAIAQIAPNSKPILVARVRTQDVGNVRVGNIVDILPASFDVGACERLRGRVEQIVPAALGTLPPGEEFRYCEVRIVLTGDKIDKRRVLRGVQAACRIYSNESFTLIDRARRFLAFKHF